MDKFTIEALKAQVNDNALFAIDHTLQALSGCDQAETPDLVDLLAEAILVHLERPIIDGPVDSLFDQSFSQKDRRFIAICLLRLLSLNDFYFRSNNSFNIKVFALFDDTISRDIYEELNVDPKEQTYEKSRKLKDATPEAESRVRETVDSLRNLDHLGVAREQFMRTLNSRLVRALVWPFLPRPLVYKSRLHTVFGSIRDYYQASRAEVMEAFEQARMVAEQYLEEAQSCKTYYCQHYLIEFAQELKRLLQQDFYSRDVGQPANLDVKPSNKKYPFHQEDQGMSLRFVVENRGPGYAFEVELSASSLIDNVKVTRPNLQLGRLEPGLVIADFPAWVMKSEEIAFIQVEASWRNADRSPVHRSYQFELEGQRTDINWGKLQLKDPYSLEPVESHEQLVGREEIMNQLLRQSRATRVGSSYVYGQKRVGKTSIAKALQSQLSQYNDPLVIYLEGGEYIGGGPKATLNRLGAKICERIKKSDERLADLAVPEFDGALYPLSDFLENLLDYIPDMRVLIILDEFDEMPADLYRRGQLADAFFLTLRAISGKPSFGFLLVGGERIGFVKSCQGDTFNKFLEILVDYFDREEHWTDFQELVRAPTQEWLEITDDAVLALHRQTAGNPYFTMCICRELFRSAANRRDCFVTSREVDEEAAPRALRHIGTGFYHFWEDGIFESTGVKVEEVSIRRRRILLALAKALRNEEKASKDEIANQDIVATLDPYTVGSELRQFVQRRILIEESGLFDCKVPFFRTWLESAGTREILTTFSDLDAIMKRRRREEQAYVQPEEIVELISGWGPYQGKLVTEDQVRAWLRQFDDYIKQRLMFKVLQNLKFYSKDLMREKMKEAHGIVRRGLIWRKDPGQRKRGDILVSYLDSPGKSGGGIYAKLYADENGIYYKNVIERGNLAEVLSEREDLQALLFIDDFIGTGGSAQTYFRQLAEESGVALREAELKTYFIAVTGFQESQNKVEKTLVECNLPVEVHICDPLDPSAECFGESSRIFTGEAERLQAMRIAQEYGARIVSRNPLGYGGCQTAIVFPESCPNNNLPILWAECDDPPWRPLFRRPMPRKQF